jgi:hypothetical protein
MHFETYDYINGQPLGTFQQLDFGDLIQNQHCVKPVVFRAIPDQETNVSNLALYLENKGPWKDSNFGIYAASAFIPSIQAGSNVFNLMVEVPGAVSDSSNGNSIEWDSTASNYIWLDAQIHNVTGFSQANFRLFFDHN